MAYVFLLVVWLAVGAAAGVVEARHGHWHKGWVVSALLGPFAIPLAIQSRRDLAPAPVVVLESRPRDGPVDLLVGLDGSDLSLSAAVVALGLLGPLTRRITLAAVLDLDTAGHVERVPGDAPYPEETAARDLLDRSVREVGAATGLGVGTVVLGGEPAEALGRYALDEGYELIAVGCRGSGLSKRVLGSCAAKLARHAPVPVLVVPATPLEHAAGGTGGGAARPAPG